eukprot:m.261652 g.261652  ORF g.261652 m.261652 type:complete len:56 (+) comp45753_c0_seq1:133-300(+)
MKSSVQFSGNCTHVARDVRKGESVGNWANSTWSKSVGLSEFIGKISRMLFAARLV